MSCLPTSSSFRLPSTILSIGVLNYIEIFNFGCVHHHRRWMTSNLGGCKIFCPKCQVELESRQKRCPTFLLFFQKMRLSETDFCPTGGGCSPLHPTLMFITYIVISKCALCLSHSDSFHLFLSNECLPQ